MAILGGEDNFQTWKSETETFLGRPDIAPRKSSSIPMFVSQCPRYIGFKSHFLPKSPAFRFSISPCRPARISQVFFPLRRLRLFQKGGGNAWLYVSDPKAWRWLQWFMESNWFCVFWIYDKICILVSTLWRYSLVSQYLRFGNQYVYIIIYIFYMLLCITWYMIWYDMICYVYSIYTYIWLYVYLDR